MVRKKNHDRKPRETRPEKGVSARLTAKPGLLALGGYFIIAVVLTFPLLFRMNNSVYGFYDHVSTDLFANIHFYFWSLKHSIVDLRSSPLYTPLFAAPFGSRVNLVNFTGYVQLPITIAFGHLFSRNFTILFNLVVSGLGMFYLVRHVTGSAAAGFLSGIVFAFCPNMLVRSYTTFDSTQVQWIPLYTLFVLKFVGERTWRNAVLAGVFLTFNILFAMPYYLIYLPVHTVVVLLVYAGWRIWGEGRGFDGLFRDLTTPDALRNWGKIIAVLGVVVVVFLVYYTTIVGGAEYSAGKQRTVADLERLALKPTDYLMPHPRSALLKGNIKESYWNRKRPGKDPDSFVAYAGYIALALAVYGALKGGRGVFRWVFLAGAAVAFWSTLGPRLFGLPTPSGLIHSLYAPFARRILIYKVFVQMGVAGLAGLGAAALFENRKIAGRTRTAVLVVSGVLMILEYSLVPPALSVDLRNTPEIYEVLRELPGDAVLMEVPLRRNSGNLFQGYVYYQIHHGKRLFNPYFGLSRVPERIRPFYRQMEVPIEAQEYANLAALRWLGVTHLTYHWYIGTNTVAFGSYPAPKFSRFAGDDLVFGEIDGLKRIYAWKKESLEKVYGSPYDYAFANLYENTAEPCPVALVFDYRSPYEPVPGMLERDGVWEFGYLSAFIDTSATFYYPVADGDRLVRLLRQGGRVTAVNMSGEPVEFSIRFTAESPDSNRVIETKWNGGPVNGRFEIGPEPVRCTVRKLYLGPEETGELTVWSTKEAFLHEVEVLGRKTRIPASAVLSDFRVELE